MSEELTIPVKRVGEAIGTLGWLRSKGPYLHVGNAKKDNVRGVWLKAADGTTLECLAQVSQEYGLEMIDRRVNAAMEANYPWTDATWNIIQQLVEYAERLLEEPSVLAEAWSITFTPHKDPTVMALAKVAQTMPDAYRALADRLEELGE